MRALAFLAAAATAGCASLGDSPGDARAMALGLSGGWDNARQIAEAPPELVGERPPGAPWIAPRAIEARVEPGADKDAAQIEVIWREGFEGSQLRVETWSFFRADDGSGLRLLIGAPGARLDPRCALIVRALGGAHFDAASDPLACRTTGPDGRTLGLERRVTATTTGILAQDVYWSGPDEIAYKVPGATPAELRRR